MYINIYILYCCCSVTQSCPTLWPHGLQLARPPCPSPSPGVCPSSYSLFSWCCPIISSSDTLLSFCSQSFPASGTFPIGCLVHIRRSKYWSFSFSISPSTEWIFHVDFLDWFDLLAIQVTLRSLLLHHSLKASTLWCSAFFTAQLSQPYMTPGKTIALTLWTFVNRVMSLFFNTLSRLFIAILDKKQLFSDFVAAVTVHTDFGAQEEEIGHYFCFCPFYFPCGNGARS